jgi:hypothetical protein
LLLALALAACGVSDARATQTASISASFEPQRLGAPTVVSMGFRLTAPPGQLPEPLTGLEFRYPAQLGIATSGLGTATCDPTRLEMEGPAVCPANSIMGHGSANVAVPFGGEVVSEKASIALVAGPSQSGYVRLLVCATGLTPVAARIVMPTLLLAGHLRVAVPLVPSLPNGPDVSVVSARVSLGGRLTYHERRHGKTVAYHPQGARLPRRCPRGGFRFSAAFSFLDGERAAARTTVPCAPRA